MFECAVFTDIFESLKLFFKDKEQAFFCIKASILFIDVAISPRKIFDASVVLNY